LIDYVTPWIGMRLEECLLLADAAGRTGDVIAGTDPTATTLVGAFASLFTAVAIVRRCVVSGVGGQYRGQGVPISIPWTPRRCPAVPHRKRV